MNPESDIASQPASKKVRKGRITRSFQIDFIQYGFVKYGKDDEPKVKCVICDLSYSNMSIRLSRLQNHLHNRHPELKDKDADFFRGYTSTSNYKSDEENVQDYRIIKEHQPDDVDCEVYGRYVAIKLRDTVKMQRILAERLVNEVLSLARLGTLTEFHSITSNIDPIKIEPNEIIENNIIEVPPLIQCTEGKESGQVVPVNVNDPSYVMVNRQLVYLVKQPKFMTTQTVEVERMSSEDDETMEVHSKVDAKRHELVRKEGLARNGRRYCRRCYQLNTKFGRLYARRKATRVMTYCDGCDGRPYFCLSCFNLEHRNISV